MVKKSINIGTMSRENYKKRTIAIARGKYKPKKCEPKVWFESVQSTAQVLSSENQELLRIIEEQKPIYFRGNLGWSAPLHQRPSLRRPARRKTMCGQFSQLIDMRPLSRQKHPQWPFARIARRKFRLAQQFVGYSVPGSDLLKYYNVVRFG